MEASEVLSRLPGLGLRGRGEASLIRRAQAGSAEAFDELFRRHWRPTYRAAYLVVGDAAAAEDVAQEAILAAIRGLDGFDRSRPFGPWLHRIAVNRAIDFARAARLRPAVGVSEERIEEESGSAEVDELLSDALVQAIGGLSEEHRAVICLRYLLDYSPGEIAEMLELPRGTVNSRLRRALDALRPALEEGRDG